jgi:putative ABC transport system permease protein
LRDLQWRRRRFLIAVLATGLVFAMTLLLSGTSNALHSQDRRIIDSFGADSWFVAENASGPFTTTTPVLVDAADALANEDGVDRAAPVLLSRATVDVSERRDANLVGIPVDGLGIPEIADGRWLKGSGEVVLDTELDADVGDRVNVGGVRALVVGKARDVTYFFGTPTVYMPLEDAQAQLFGGQPLANAVVVTGDPAEVPDGLQKLSVADVREDLARPTKSGDDTISLINALLWIVAAGIIGSIVYLSSLERARDFAVMKATGASSGSLLGGLALQAIILSILSAIVAGVLAQLILPSFPFAVEIDVATYVALVVVAVVIGLIASVAGLQKTVRVDPALAFGGN